MKREFLSLLILFFFFLAGASVQAASFIIVDNETGCILAEKNRDQKNATASLAQIALAVTVIDWAALSKTSLDTMVTLPADTAHQGAANPLGLREGDRLTLRDLLYLSVMISDSEAAFAIASFVGGQLPNPQQLDHVGNFVSQMNALATKLHMRNTLFLNPSGRDLPSQAEPYSTAADLARLVRYACSKPGLLFYTAQRSRTIQVEREGKKFQVLIQNRNTLLGREHVDGVKIGHTAQANGCFALTSENRPEVRREGSTVYTAPRRIIVVLLHSSDSLTEKGMELVQQGWQLYQTWVREGRPEKGHRFL